MILSWLLKTLQHGWKFSKIPSLFLGLRHLGYFAICCITLLKVGILPLVAIVNLNASFWYYVLILEALLFMLVLLAFSWSTNIYQNLWVEPIYYIDHCGTTKELNGTAEKKENKVLKKTNSSSVAISNICWIRNSIWTAVHFTQTVSPARLVTLNTTTRTTHHLFSIVKTYIVALVSGR